MTRFTYSYLHLGLSLLCGVFIGCAAETGLDSDAQTAEIHGGTRSNFPFVVQVGNDDGSACSGVLFAPDYVLTAGHCRSRTNTTRKGFSWIMIEKHNANGTVSPEYFYVHSAEAMDKNVGGDVAVLRLKRKVPAHLATPAVLAPKGYSPNKGSKVVAVGWGMTREGGVPHTQQRRFMGTVTHKAHVGGSLFDADRRSSFTFESAGRNSACGGDSGGPIWSGFYVAGVITHGDNGPFCDNGRGYENTALDVGRYRDIIDWYRYVLATK